MAISPLLPVYEAMDKAIGYVKQAVRSLTVIEMVRATPMGIQAALEVLNDPYIQYDVPTILYDDPTIHYNNFIAGEVPQFKMGSITPQTDIGEIEDTPKIGRK